MDQSHGNLCGVIVGHAVCCATTRAHARVDELPGDITLLAEGVLAELDAQGATITGGQHCTLQWQQQGCKLEGGQKLQGVVDTNAADVYRMSARLQLLTAA